MVWDFVKHPIHSQKCTLDSQAFKGLPVPEMQLQRKTLHEHEVQ